MMVKPYRVRVSYLHRQVVNGKLSWSKCHYFATLDSVRDCLLDYAQNASLSAIQVSSRPRESDLHRWPPIAFDSLLAKTVIKLTRRWDRKTDVWYWRPATGTWDDLAEFVGDRFILVPLSVRFGKEAHALS
jgi:hypothetical protein